MKVLFQQLNYDCNWFYLYIQACAAYIEIMTPDIQTIIALGLVAGAVFYFVRGWFVNRKKHGCGGGCGCGCSGKKIGK